MTNKKSNMKKKGRIQYAQEAEKKGSLTLTRGASNSTDATGSQGHDQATTNAAASLAKRTVQTRRPPNTTNSYVNIPGVTVGSQETTSVAPSSSGTAAPVGNPSSDVGQAGFQADEYPNYAQVVPCDAKDAIDHQYLHHHQRTTAAMGIAMAYKAVIPANGFHGWNQETNQTGDHEGPSGIILRHDSQLPTLEGPEFGQGKDVFLDMRVEMAPATSMSAATHVPGNSSGPDRENTNTSSKSGHCGIACNKEVAMEAAVTGVASHIHGTQNETVTPSQDANQDARSEPHKSPVTHVRKRSRYHYPCEDDEDELENGASNGSPRKKALMMATSRSRRSDNQQLHTGLDGCI